MSKIIKYTSTKIQECNFLKIKNPTSKIIQDLDAEKMLTLLDFGPGKPKPSNIHIYHFHILEPPHLDFSKFWGGWGGIN